MGFQMVALCIALSYRIFHKKVVLRQNIFFFALHAHNFPPMSFTPLTYLTQEDDNTYYCSYAASPDGQYIARSNDLNAVEVYDASGEYLVVDNLSHPKSVCFVNSTNLLIADSGNKRIIECTAVGEHVRIMLVRRHNPLSIVCNSPDVVISLMGVTALRVYNYDTFDELREIDLSDYFKGKGLTLTRCARAAHVLVHDLISEKVGVVNYLTGTFVGYVHTSREYADVYDFGDIYALGKYNAPIELRDCNGNVVDSHRVQDMDSIIAMASDANKLLVHQLSVDVDVISWYQPWRFTSRAAFVRIVLI